MFKQKVKSNSSRGVGGWAHKEGPGSVGGAEPGPVYGVTVGQSGERVSSRSTLPSPSCSSSCSPSGTRTSAGKGG